MLNLNICEWKVGGKKSTERIRRENELLFSAKVLKWGIHEAFHKIISVLFIFLFI